MTSRRRMVAAAAAVAVVFAAALAASGGALSRPAAPAAAAVPAPATWTGDTTHSHVLYRVTHLGVSSSFGRFNDFTVSLQAGDGGADLAGVQFTVGTESVDSGNAKRDQHLKSPDFLNAKQFPEMTFQSTAVKAVDKDRWDVTGDFTLHGVKKPLTARVSRIGSGKGMKGEELAGYETTFTIKRTDHGMSNMVGPVGDEVQVTLAVEAARK